jgi:hypothetical protein
MSDSAGYPHLNHIIRFPQPDVEHEALAWFHCPHCPCTLGLTWVHPKEMPTVEEHVGNAPWLPRVADFESYNRLFDDGDVVSPESASPMDFVSTPQSVLAERTNGLNVPENTPSTPVVHRKPPIDGTRKSARKLKPTVRISGTSPIESTPTYKPRKSKYDIR